MGHGAVAVRDVVKVDRADEDLAGFDPSFEDVGHEFLYVGARGCGAAGEGDVAAEEAAETDGCDLVLGDADTADDPAGRTTP